MGNNPSKNVRGRGENEPLLPRSEGRVEDEEPTRFTKFVQMVSRNAVAVAIVTLLTAVVILLLVFFGGNSCALLFVKISNNWNPQ